MSQTQQPQHQADSDQDARESEQQVTFWTVVKSTMAAAIGVQSRKNRERDFQHGSPAAFITAGLIFTAGFIAVLVLIVRWVIG